MERTGKILLGGWYSSSMGKSNKYRRYYCHTVGPNSLNLEALSASAGSFATDAGTAVPTDAGVLSVLGGSNLNTSATGSTVFVNLNDSVSVAGHYRQPQRLLRVLGSTPVRQ